MLLRKALRTWMSVALVRARGTRALAARRRARSLGAVLAIFAAYRDMRRIKASKSSGARRHYDLRLAHKALVAWRHVNRRSATAAAHLDNKQAVAATGLSKLLLQRRGLAAWSWYVNVHRLPKTLKRRRAAAHHVRATLRKALGALADYADATRRLS